MAKTFVYFIFLPVLNICVISNAGFVRSPASDSDIKGIIKHSLELKCKFVGEGFDGTFEGWYKDDEPVSKEKQGHYAVHNSKDESVLTIKIFVKEDHDVKEWYVKTTQPGFEKPPQCVFKKIPLVPSPQRVQTDKEESIDTNHGSLRRDNGDPVNLKCVVEPEVDDNLVAAEVKWEFSPDGKDFSAVPNGVKISKETLSIESVSRAHRGYYRCIANDISFTFLLRVKERLAALWPFLGIVSVVIILVTIILIFEKRQRSAKKAAANDEDDNDHTKDPLVRATNKPADEENKKRAVKA